MPKRVNTPDVEVVIVAAGNCAVQKILDDVLHGDGDVDMVLRREVLIGVKVANDGSTLGRGPVKRRVGRVVRDGQGADLSASLVKASISCAEIIPGTPAPKVGRWCRSRSQRAHNGPARSLRRLDTRVHPSC